ncbi:MAG: N-acetyl-gamma-glutamyl-phosphate reductase [Pseudomonadota bacterium]
MIKVGLVGARGYVGREFIRLLDEDERFSLTFASSRQLSGKPLGTSPGLAQLRRFGSLEAVEMSPKDVAATSVDVIILGLPNGMAAPYVAALDAEAHSAIIIDLSADYRHKEGWLYGAPEIFAAQLPGARRIANPGCYATAANLGLWPLRDSLSGPASVFGVSGFSGAGTTPGPKNDPERLEANLLPYGFGGHGHEAEIERVTGLDIVFAPHVAAFFRGLIVTITAPLSSPMTVDEVYARFEAAYADCPNVIVQAEFPEIASVAGRDVCMIGGFAVSKQGRMLTYSSALDNLRKGAATQAMENIRLACGLDDAGA